MTPKQREEAAIAWRVCAEGFDDAIVLAKTRSKARYASFEAAKDAGYDVPFSDIRVARAREYDGAPIKPGRCIIERYVRYEIADMKRQERRRKGSEGR